MLNRILHDFVLGVLSLRYSVKVTGLEEIKKRGRSGILFLPTHPALIDPILLGTVLLPDFRARPFADQDAVNLPGVRSMVRYVRGFTIPTVARYGQEAVARIEDVVMQAAEALRGGDNVMLYPAGRTLRTRYEFIGATSAVETILRHDPDVRIVLVKTRGLWGSSFSLFDSPDPDVAHIFKRGAGRLLSNFVFFGPRRPVEISFHEPADFPRHADRSVINPYIERFFNEDAPPATYVPYTIWERGGIREVPDPERPEAADADDVPASTRSIVIQHLCELTGATTIRDSDHLARDLGLDSLARAELIMWVESEFGFPQGNTDSLQTVADVLLAASGAAIAKAEFWVHPPPARWTSGQSDARLDVGRGETVAAAFLDAAARHPGAVVVGDVASGLKTYQDLVVAILALLPAVRALPGDSLGLMLPASVAAVVSYLVTVFAGRTPVMINWTVGRRNLLHGLELTKTQRVITVKPLVAKLRKQGLDLSGIEERLVYLEDLGASVPRTRKLWALLSGRLSLSRLPGLSALSGLGRAPLSPIAAVLFTSGSESMPKAVPLSHANIVNNLRDVMKMIHVTGRDRLLAILPPFHSFGLTADLVLPLVTGTRAVYHPNPIEGGVLAETIEAYKVTVALATPTFLNGILRAATRKQLESVRLGIVGAEECPQHVYDLLAQRCPGAVMIEGYGITECSPVVALNVPEDPRPRTIGRLLPSLEHVILDVETDQPVQPGETGMLLLRGPSIFSGYLGEAPDPFVEHDGRKWYRTGDLVREAPDGVLTFAGRLKRFIKLGGEMISLPAIESALLETFGSAQDEGPVLAVVATADEHPELVLFTVRNVQREEANRAIRAAGLSALHNLRRVHPVEAIPILGTGKTDYRALQAMLTKTEA